MNMPDILVEHFQPNKLMSLSNHALSHQSPPTRSYFNFIWIFGYIVFMPTYLIVHFIGML